MYHVSRFYFIIGAILVLIVGIIIYVLFTQSSTPESRIFPTPTPVSITSSSETPRSAPIQLSSPPQNVLQKITVGTPIIIQPNSEKTPIALTYTLSPKRETEYYIQGNQIRVLPKTFWMPNTQYKLTIKSIAYTDGGTQPLNTVIGFQAKNTDDETESPPEVFNKP